MPSEEAMAHKYDRAVQILTNTAKYISATETYLENLILSFDCISAGNDLRLNDRTTTREFGPNNEYFPNNSEARPLRAMEPDSESNM